MTLLDAFAWIVLLILAVSAVGVFGIAGWLRVASSIVRP